MINKNFIMNADCFGMSSSDNKAVLEGYVNGFLTSASLCTNFEYFEDAINNVLPDCQNLSVGIQLNVTKGVALTDCPLLTDERGNFNSGFIYLLQKKSPELAGQIEQEFRAQIEKLLAVLKPTHICSVDDIHIIPYIFEIVAKLAQEYGIKFISTHYEELYFVPKFTKHLNLTYLSNIVKWIFCKSFTNKNKIVASKYSLKTNDFIVGILYSNLMDIHSIEYALKEINQESIVECIIHPKKYDNSIKDSHTKEFSLTLDKNLEERIKKAGFTVTNYNNL